MQSLVFQNIGLTNKVGLTITLRKAYPALNHVCDMATNPQAFLIVFTKSLEDEFRFLMINFPSLVNFTEIMLSLGGFCNV